MGKCNLAGLQTDGNAGAEAVRFPILRTSSGGRRLTPESTQRDGRRFSRWLIVWGPAVAWAAVLFLLSELRGVPLRPSFAMNDKFVHMALYSILGALLSWAVFASRRARWPGRRVPYGVAVLVGLAYGAVDELHQAFVPNRMPSVGDWVADASGVFIGFAIGGLLLASLADHLMFAGQPERDLA